MIIYILMSITVHLSTVYQLSINSLLSKTCLKKHKINALNIKIKFDYLETL